MPSGRSSGQPNRQELSAFIQWHQAREQTRSETFSYAENRYRNISQRTFNDVYNHTLAAQRYGRRFNDFKGDTSQGRLSIPGLSRTCNTIRVAYQVKIIIDKGGQRGSGQTFGFIEDIESGGTVQDIRDKLASTFDKWAKPQYRIKNNGEGRYKPDITVTSMECI